MNIGVDYLKPGMIVKENIYIGNLKGIPFIKADTILNENIISRLKKSDIDSVKIKVKINENETIDDELRDLVTNSLKEIDIESVIASTNTIVGKILSNSRFNYDLSRYIVSNEDIHEHCLNITLFAVELAKIYNEKNKNAKPIDLKNVATAAIFSQIGKTLKKDVKLEDYQIDLNKDLFTNIKGDEFKTYNDNMYPLYSYAVLKKISDESLVPSICKVAILLEKENYSDMKQGPLGANSKFLKDNPAFPISQIINVCTAYEQLLSDSLKQNANPSNVIEMMKLKEKQGEINSELCDLLLTSIPLYSVGTKVILKGRLSDNIGNSISFNGVEAEVVEYNLYFQDRPKVRVNGVILDLFRATTVTIDRIANIDLSNFIQDGINIEENIRRM